MKTMHRTSTVGLLIGSALVAVGAIVLTALTGAGAGGAYAFLFAGMAVLSVFLIWPERTRPFRSNSSHRSVRR
jgi:hypothetical protein